MTRLSPLPEAISSRPFVVPEAAPTFPRWSGHTLPSARTLRCPDYGGGSPRRSTAAVGGVQARRRRAGDRRRRTGALGQEKRGPLPGTGTVPAPLPRARWPPAAAPRDRRHRLKIRVG